MPPNYSVRTAQNIITLHVLLLPFSSTTPLSKLNLEKYSFMASAISLVSHLTSMCSVFWSTIAVSKSTHLNKPLQSLPMSNQLAALSIYCILKYWHLSSFRLEETWELFWLLSPSQPIAKSSWIFLQGSILTFSFPLSGL